MRPNNDEGQPGPKRNGANPGSDIKDIVRQLKDWFEQITHGRRPQAVFALKASIGLAAPALPLSPHQRP